MKCEIKYIENNIRRDYRRITVKGLLIVAIVSFTGSFILSMFLKDFIIYLLLLFFFLLLLCVVWGDAVDYCKNRNTNIQKQQPEE